MAVRYVLPFLLLAATATAQPIPDTLRAPAEADSITVYGWTVDADGDRLLVGARVWPRPYPRSQNLEADATQRADHHGTVFVYRRQPGGEWTVEGRLKADYISNEDCFSWSMDLRGDLAAVSAECEYGENPDGTFRGGAVYLFRYDGAEWMREAKIYPSDVSGPWSPAGAFGESVSLGDGYFVVGAAYTPNPANPNEDAGSGAAFVFEQENDVWTHTATLVNEDADMQIDEDFGFTVAVSGSSVLVGAPHASSPETDRSGAVYVFESAGDEWVQMQKVTAPKLFEGDYFGELLAADSDGAVAGSRTAVYLLEREGGEWVVGAGLITEDKPYAIARNGDRILTVDSGTAEGTIGHLFIRSGIDWNDTAFSVPPFIGRNELVSLSDRQAFVGVPTFDSGQVLVYDLGQFVAGEPEAATPPPLALSIAPNPAVRDATIHFELPQAGTVRMTVYDVLGREVARLVEEARPAGAQSVGLDANGLAPGVYILRLQTERQAVAQRFTVVR